MDELKTILGTEIPIETRGILYLCHYDRRYNILTVGKEILFESGGAALTAYANIPNPESQLVTGKTFDELITNLILLHENIKDPKWLNKLAECL